MFRTCTSGLAAAILLASCGDASHAPTAPEATNIQTTATDANATRGNRGAPNGVTATARWNLRTREIIGRRGGNSNDAARTYALVAVAQYNAVVVADRRTHARVRPSRAAASAAASAAVLAALYPAEQAYVDAQLKTDSIDFAAYTSERRDDWKRGLAAGRMVATDIVTYAAADRSTAVWSGSVPTGIGYWIPAPAPAKPVGALWGQVRPWLMQSGNMFRADPPPPFGSARYLTDLAEVHALSDAPTAEHLRIAKFWAGDFGFGGPAGYFGALATDLAAKENMGERHTARMLAVLHMAIMDASIGCFDSKYAYWYIRPYQADPTVKTWVSRPNFPSYPSAHSCLSSAAGGVLTGFFPSAADSMQVLVQQAGVARIYAGLHFRFDVDAGRVLGHSVAVLALSKTPRPNELISLDAKP